MFNIEKGFFIKKLFWGFILLLTISCSDTSDTKNRESTSLNQQQEIKYTAKVNWIGHWLNEDKRELLVRETGVEFEFTNQEIEVNLKFPQEIIGNRNSEDQANFIIELINSPKPAYDIVWLESGIYKIIATKLGDPYWGKKYLVDFSDNETYLASHKDFIIDNPYYKNQMGGIFAGAFLEGYYYSIWYNEEIANKIGIVIKDYEMTFDDLLQYVKSVDTYNKNNETKIAAFYESADWSSSEILFQNLFCSLINNSAESESSRKNALKKTLQAFEEMGKYSPLINSHKTNIWFDTRDLPLNNECLFYVQGTWMYSHWRGINKDKMAKMTPAELPVFQKGDHYLGGYISTFSVLKNAPNRVEATKLMLYWCKPDMAERWVRYTKNPTGLKGNVTSAEFGGDKFEEFQSSLTKKYGSNVSYSQDASYLGISTNSDITAKLNSLIIQLLEGKTTANKAFNQLYN